MILTLLSSDTADADTSLVISSNITSTYDEYMLVMTNMNMSVDREDNLFSFSQTGTFSAENALTSVFQSALTEANADTWGYESGHDLAVTGTGIKTFMTSESGSAADESIQMILHLFSPSNTTYNKHFYFTATGTKYEEGCVTIYVGGIIHATEAITQIKFAPSSGNFDGVFQLYGVA